jgi:hypothetical protein
VLRGEDELDGRPGDVDLLVAPTDLPTLRLIARGLGFARLPASGYASHVFLIAYDEPTDRWLKLDVVDELAFGPRFSLVAPDTSVGACLAHRQRSGPVSLLDPADGFWALLLHVVLDRAGIAEERRTRLVELAPAGRNGGPLAEVVAPLLPAGWSVGRVADAVERGDWDGLERLGHALAGAWRRREWIAVARRRLGGTVGRRAGRVARLRRPRGLGVALVGLPVQTAELATALRASPVPARTASAGRARGARRTGVEGLRQRLRLADGLVIERAETLADVGLQPGGGPALRNRRAETLSSPAPDLVIVLDPDGGPGSGGAEESRPPEWAGSDIRTVDASLPGERLRRVVGRLVWSRLADRWNAMDRGSTEP